MKKSKEPPSEQPFLRGTSNGTLPTLFTGSLVSVGHKKQNTEEFLQQYKQKKLKLSTYALNEQDVAISAELRSKVCVSTENRKPTNEKSASVLKNLPSEPVALKCRERLSLKNLELRVPIIPRDKLEISTSVLGEGGQSLIKKGKFRETNVAIKCFRRSKELFLAFREMLLLDRIRHPNIISIMGVAEGLVDYYLVLEFYESYSLHSVLFLQDVRDTYQLNLQQKHHIAMQLCQALNYLHLEDIPICHRDVKPENILIEWAGERRFYYNMKLIDLGMAKCKELQRNLNTSDGNCKIRGTQFYNSPEVIKKEEPCPKSDVWSAGCTFIELYSGDRAWKFEETDIVTDHVREAILKGESPNIKGTPKILHSILAKTLIHDRAQRCSIADVLRFIRKQIISRDIYDD